MTTYSEVVAKARAAFLRGVTKPLEFRIQQLKNLLRMLDENEDKFAKALHEDLRKPKQESVLLEVEFIRNDIRCMLYNVKKWAQPEYTEKNMILIFDDAYILSEPYGVVLVLGAWNYPIQLSICPMVGAITAGNCCILKPSEVSPRSADILKELIPRYLDPECFHVITGGVEETTELLKERFDYIFYTGSYRVGQIVREAANKHLTPVTLELGGKSPVYIDQTVDLEVVCKRLLWGKFINAGQTCVAPDYILCTPEVQKNLVKSINKILLQFFGRSPEDSSDLGRIVNERNFQRVRKLLKSGTIAIGGDVKENERYIAPTVLVDVQPTDPIMQEEIFGPILPIITVSGPDEAIDIINSKEKALTMYVFSTNDKLVKKFLESTSSGSACVNDSVVHLTIDALPFGGVGQSGIGSYHGKFSFDTFSHKKAVLVRSYKAIGEKLGEARYPPYSDGKINYLKTLLRKRQGISIPGFTYIVIFVLGFAFAIVLKVILHYAGVDDSLPPIL